MVDNKEVFYVYRHIRLDLKEPFYIGLGKVYNLNVKSQEKYYSRAYQKTKRNRFWNFIVEKTPSVDEHQNFSGVSCTDFWKINSSCCLRSIKFPLIAMVSSGWYRVRLDTKSLS